MFDLCQVLSLSTYNDKWKGGDIMTKRERSQFIIILLLFLIVFILLRK